MADPWIKHKFYFPPANKQFTVAEGDAVQSVDAALGLFSPLGPYPGQQEHTAAEQGAGRKRSRRMDCSYWEETLRPLLDLNSLSSQLGEPGADHPHSTWGDEAGKRDGWWLCELGQDCRHSGVTGRFRDWNLEAGWPLSLSPRAPRWVPFSPTHFMACKWREPEDQVLLKVFPEAKVAESCPSQSSCRTHQSLSVYLSFLA